MDVIQKIGFAEVEWEDVGSSKIRAVKGQHGEIKLNTMAADKGFLYGLTGTRPLISVHQQQTFSPKIWHKNALQRRTLLLLKHSETLNPCQG